jgi:CheY-like chemotaxis protein
LPGKILVVDDEPIVRFNIAEALRDLDVAVTEAASADEAWEYLAADSSIALVFTDHQMPGAINGTQLAERIKAECPSVKVVITSGHVSAKEVGQSVLSKPYPLIETAAALVRLVSLDE